MGGAREDPAASSTSGTGCTLSVGTSQVNRKTGATAAGTAVRKIGIGPVWHSKQQCPGAWCDSCCGSNALAWAAVVSDSSSRMSSARPKGFQQPAVLSSQTPSGVDTDVLG